MTIDATADEVLATLGTGRQIAPFTTRASGLTLEESYRALALLDRKRMAHGETRRGRKIGFTNRTIWAQYKVYAPIWGYVYDTTVHELGNTASLRLDGFAEPRIEPEIVLGLAHAPSPDMDEGALIACIDWIAHGFEIVQTPFPGWKFKAADTVAVNALHGRLVVGVPVPVASIPDCLERLRAFRLALKKDDTVIAEGGGANVLGSPLLAFAHLADLLVTLPQFPPVAAGEIVTTGTLTAVPPVGPGDTWSTTLSGIGLPGLTITVERSRMVVADERRP